MTTSPSHAAPPPGPARRRFLLTRVADAVRRQDWFTVIVEVVIGFQVTDWGQRRADRAKEETYLRQLATDLRETTDEIAQARAQQQSVSRSVARALRAYRSPERPPIDSLREWIGSSFSFYAPMPVLGTAQGIISSGDLALIRNDTLRAALTSYVERSRERRSAVQVSIVLYAEAYGEINHRLDFIEVLLGSLTPSITDSLALADADFPAPAGERVVPFPETSARLLTDRDVYSTLVTASTMNKSLLNYQNDAYQRVSELLDLVNRELKLPTTPPTTAVPTPELPAR